MIPDDYISFIKKRTAIMYTVTTDSAYAKYATLIESSRLRTFLVAAFLFNSVYVKDNICLSVASSSCKYKMYVCER